MPSTAPSRTEVALLPSELPHLLLRAACATGQTAGELLARVLARHPLTRCRSAHTTALHRLVKSGWLVVVGHAGRAHQYALTPAGETYLDDLEFESPRPRRKHA